MRFRASKFSELFNATCAHFARLLANRSGNFALTFALVALPTLLGIGASIDYVRAYNTKVKMQSDLDAALIAAIKEVDTLEEDEIKEKVETWFAAQTELDSSKYSLSDTEITISKTDKTITALATGNVATTFMGLANIESVNVSVSSSVAGPATSFMEVYIVLDKSPSMLLAATEQDRTDLKALTSKYAYTYVKNKGYKQNSGVKCEFACHNTETTTVNNTEYPIYYKVESNKYYNIYDLLDATNSGITLRADVAVKAVEEVLDMVDDSNASTSHVKVGLYTIGTTATEVLKPSATSTTPARKLLADDTSGLTSATSEDATYFNESLDELTDLVGEAGDGSSAAKPLKLVLLLTDGAQSKRSWVTDNVGWSNGTPFAASGNAWYKVAPMNPSWCSDMKTNGATVAVLYTEYLALTSDWGYNATLGDTMKSANWYSTWGGTMRSDVSSSTTRQAYIPYALKDCATSEDLFISAADSDDIESGLSSLFEQYLSTVRLTQ